jgi:hypothetical protein
VVFLTGTGCGPHVTEKGCGPHVTSRGYRTVLM